MVPARMCLLLILFVVIWIGRPAQPAAFTAIEEVDFLNFTHPLSMCVERPEDKPLQAPVTGGAFSDEEWRANIVKQEIIYTDLTDDERNEAVVPVFCGPAHANFGDFEIHIYTLRDEKPEMLSKLHSDTIAKDYDRYYNDGIGMPKGALHDLEEAGKRLTVRMLADGSRACPENQVSFDYVWNGQSYAILGKPIKKPVEDCGHKPPPVADIFGPALQLEKAQEAFLKDFMREPAVIISGVIVATIMGNSSVRNCSQTGRASRC